MKSISPRLPALLFLCIFAGCHTVPTGDVPGDGPPSADAKKPAPRTLPQAVCAYVQSFHEPLPPDDRSPKAEFEGNKESTKETSEASKKPDDKAKAQENGGDKDKNPDKSKDTGLGDRRPNGILLEKNEDPVRAARRNDDKKDDEPKAEKKGKAADTDKKDDDQAEKKKTPGEADKKDSKDEPKAEKKDPTEEGDKKDEPKDKEKEPEPAWFSGHAQFTMITQVHPSFRAPYSGMNSLSPYSDSATSETGTLFLTARLWESGTSFGDIVFNPEEAGGKGFNGVVGVAGFPNGDITPSAKLSQHRISLASFTAIPSALAANKKRSKTPPMSSPARKTSIDSPLRSASSPTPTSSTTTAIATIRARTS